MATCRISLPSTTSAGPTIRERSAAKLAGAQLQHVERDVDGRRRVAFGGVFTEEMKLRHPSVYADAVNLADETAMRLE
jgi:hypothetical protein